MKKKSFLILDDEFIQYCDINNIDDIEKLAKQIFDRGFSLLKYGEVPFEYKIEPTIIEREVIKEVPIKVVGETKIITKEIINTEEIDRLTHENNELKTKIDLMSKSIESFGRKGKMMKNSNIASLYDE
jgi:hypothetical protein